MPVFVPNYRKEPSKPTYDEDFPDMLKIQKNSNESIWNNIDIDNLRSLKDKKLDDSSLKRVSSNLSNNTENNEEKEKILVIEAKDNKRSFKLEM